MANASRTVRRQQERAAAREVRRQSRTHPRQDIPPESRSAIEDAVKGMTGADSEQVKEAVAMAEQLAGSTGADPPAELSPAARDSIGAMLEEAGEQPNKRRAKKYVVLEAKLRLLLIMPAGPAEAAGDLYCRDNYIKQGPPFSAALTKWAEGHPAVFAILNQIVTVGDLAGMILTSLAYALPPLLHHELVPAPDFLYSYFKVPRKDEGLHVVETEAA